MEWKILGSHEAAKYLGISLNKLYKLSSAGMLTRYSPTGGKIYFLQSELEDWILSKPRASDKVRSLKVMRNLLSNKSHI